MRSYPLTYLIAYSSLLWLWKTARVEKSNGNYLSRQASLYLKSWFSRPHMRETRPKENLNTSKTTLCFCMKRSCEKYESALKLPVLALMESKQVGWLCSAPVSTWKMDSVQYGLYSRTSPLNALGKTSTHEDVDGWNTGASQETGRLTPVGVGIKLL